MVSNEAPCCITLVGCGSGPAHPRLALKRHPLGELQLNISVVFRCQDQRAMIRIDRNTMTVQKTTARSLIHMSLAFYTHMF